MVYTKIIEDTKSKKDHVDFIAMKILIASNNLREYLTSASATGESAPIIGTADINTSTGSIDTSSGRSTSRNISMDVEYDTG